MAEGKKHFLVGVFDDDEVLLKAVKKIREKGIKIHDCYTPFPVHDLDEYLGYKRSRLSKVAFLFGATGTLCAIWMQTYLLGYAWPMIIGGKDFIAAPDFVPVTFEMTVLFSSLGMVGTFLVTNSLGPGKKALMFDPRSTDDKFVMAINLEKNKGFTKDQIETILTECGVSEKPFEKEV